MVDCHYDIINWKKKVFQTYIKIYIFSEISTGCTTTFVYHGTEVMAGNPYWTGSLSLADCQNSCAMDPSCSGIGFDSSSLDCSKSGRSQSKNAKSCSTCSFYHKQCGTGTYIYSFQTSYWKITISPKIFKASAACTGFIIE